MHRTGTAEGAIKGALFDPTDAPWCALKWTPI
jgi:hypothetical protein